MEEIKEVIAVQVDFRCPKCKKGCLRPTGQCFTTNPPIYPHKCTNCEYTENIRGKTYPYIDYK